jgi:type VI secretion system protein ImpK
MNNRLENNLMDSTEKTPDLLACIAPVIHALMPLKIHSDVKKISDNFRDEIIDCFDQFERKCYENQITTSQMQEAKFALTATCDELVMGSGASFRMNWMSRPLQLEFYGNNRAGEEFFERMEKLRMGSESKLKVLEVYYICLQLGFEGAYKVKGLEQLKALIVDIRAQLEDSTDVVDTKLSSYGTPTEGFVMKVGRNLPYWVIFSISLSLIMFLYMGFHYVISKDAKSSNQAIETQLAVLQQLNKSELNGESE